MRKREQKQILEVLDTIKAAQAEELYADCQDGALGIGEFIESIKGEGTQTVALLEEYCELLYKASVGELGVRALEKHMIKVENSVKNELKPDKTEVVFLSHKASMSDCLESIYFAAKEDPGCDAFWIPIPYYDLNPDGSEKREHFEGPECYGKNIECTDWQEYNIEERRPDVIYTFNAYDWGNSVTSVHKDFYNKRLCNLTELLVYVPYFVTDDNVPDYFCTVDACCWAHKIIIQSEIIREQYIKHYTEAFGNEYGVAEEKFVALGSPKFDKVVNTTRENTEIPEEWRKLIANKKVVLYNTALTPIVKYGEAVLKKLRFVLETFNNRDDVVLWWRPHPMSESTYETMQPELFNEYQHIVSDYKKAGWGIYDDTPDMHRAIAWSDAYYGDRSSLVNLYQATGKPVMIRNLKALDSTPQCKQVFTYEAEDKLWFCVRRLNALFSMDKESLELEFVGSFPDEESYIGLYKSSLYRKPAERDGVLYFPPLLAEEIATYSIKTGTFEKIKYKEIDDEKPIERDFFGAIVYDNYVFFTPLFFPGILCYDIKTKEITVHTDWLKSLAKADNYNASEGFSNPFIMENYIYLPARTANIIIEFNMETNESVIHKVGKSDYRFIGGNLVGGNFRLKPRKGTNTPQIKWNPKTGQVNEYTDISEDEKKDIKYTPEVIAAIKPLLMSYFSRDTSSKKVPVGYSYYESYIILLDYYLDYVLQGKFSPKKLPSSINTDGTTGQNIYEHTRSII